MMETAEEGFAAVRRSLESFDEQVLARYWGENSAVRQGLRSLLGSLDQLGERLFDASSPVDVVFTLPASVQAETVALTGEFNGWSRTATFLERGGDGTWRATVALAPGRYQYKYLLDGERWENDPQAETISNPYGSVDSVITVGEKSRSRLRITRSASGGPENTMSSLSCRNSSAWCTDIGPVARTPFLRHNDGLHLARPAATRPATYRPWPAAHGLPPPITIASLIAPRTR
jgi:hypothetical protein